MKTTAKLPLPIGVSDFKELVSGYYYVDKTLMLKEFIDSKPKVSLFTRPRRFGKTLAMDMLKTFFEVSDTDTSKYFKNKRFGAAARSTVVSKENTRSSSLPLRILSLQHGNRPIRRFVRSLQMSICATMFC